MCESEYPRFVPTRIDTHPILGDVVVYVFDNYPIANDSGCQTNFFTNNAEPNNPNQYGFKMFNTSIEAYAAYQRQTLAAKEGLAPPTGRMIRWIVKNIRNRVVNRWGYETCLADVSDYGRNKATILSCPQLTRWYTDYVDENNLQLFSLSSMNSFLEKAEEEEYETANGMIFSRFSFAGETSVEGSLRCRLMNINLVGTQYDNLATIHDISESWSESNVKLRLGGVVTEDDDIYMSNDMHCGNIGLWMDNPVVIDFGYHIASPEYRNYSAIETVANWYGKTL
jgi:hypothetical protein